MTIDEAIKRMENIAEENQRVVDTGIVFDDVTIDMMYADDTEVIEEHLANYQRCAEEHRQLAEWLKELKQLKEQTRWIPLTKRPTTEEEREYYKGWPDAGDDVVFDGESPENNQEVLVSYGGDVRTDIFCKEDGGYHFECVDIRKVEAWMPLPEPMKVESEDEE